MLEISNHFLLAGLVILAITCIYLLYINLSRSTESNTLKAAVSSLVRQNTKRDELINFLMERVETLTNQTNTLLTHTLPAPSDVVLGTSATDLEELHPSTADDTNLDDLLNSVADIPNNTPVIFSDDSHKDLTSIEEEDNVGLSSLEVDVVAAPLETLPPVTDDLETPPSPVDVPTDCFAMKSEFGEPVILGPTPGDTDDLIGNILADDAASQISEIDSLQPINLLAIPKDKQVLETKYNVKQLKNLAKQLGVKSRGNKTELIEQIFSKL